MSGSDPVCYVNMTLLTCCSNMVRASAENHRQNLLGCRMRNWINSNKKSSDYVDRNTISTCVFSRSDAHTSAKPCVILHTAGSMYTFIHYLGELFWNIHMGEKQQTSKSPVSSVFCIAPQFLIIKHENKFHSVHINKVETFQKPLYVPHCWQIFI